jgi:hypothetical protein
MKIIRFTIAFITIISFSCKQQSAKKTDVNNAGKEIRLSLVNGSSSVVPAALTAKQNNTIANRPTCCKKVPSRFKLNVND